MTKFKIFLLFIAIQSILNAQTVNYITSNSIISNPERGLSKYSITASNYATVTNANNLSVTTLNNWKNSNDKITVVYRFFNLDAFINSNINSTYLNNIQNDFNNIRTAGLKVIVRFAYSDAITTNPQQPTKSQILTHISQLSPVLTSNKDIILALQAGFIGTWGEWYYTNSTEFGTEDNISNTQWLNRKEIIDAMLTATPTEISTQVRYVGIKKTLYGTSQLDNTTAYQNSANARIGFYNDAFLNNYGDMGTYSVGNCVNPVGTEDYNYLSNETKYLPMTGETNGLNPCNSGFRTTGSNALNEMELTNWSCINRDYHLNFWNQVISSNHYNDILKKIGYRFVLNSSTISLNNSDLNLTLNINNVGFARPFKARNVYLVLKNTSSSETIIRQINTDIRTWESAININQNFNLNNLNGTYNLYIWMPDNDSTLNTRPEYCIQFANDNTWDNTTGYNNLSQSITLNNLSSEEFNNNSEISFYPNPSKDFIFFNNNNLGEEIDFYNTNGQLVLTKRISKQNKVDINDLPKGIYVLKLKNNLKNNSLLLKE